MDNIYIELLEKAKNASKNAYSKYSNFSVGACVLYESGNSYCGCNVENASYGLSTCAERNAISVAISSGEKSKISVVAIYSPNQKKCLPCGACRQWINEFASGDDTRIILEDNNGIKIYLFKELFPNSFKFD